MNFAVKGEQNGLRNTLFHLIQRNQGIPREHLSEQIQEFVPQAFWLDGWFSGGCLRLYVNAFCFNDKLDKIHIAIFG